MVWQSYTHVRLLIHARISPVAPAFASFIPPRILGSGAEKSPTKKRAMILALHGNMEAVLWTSAIYCGTIMVMHWHVRLAAHVSSA